MCIFTTTFPYILLDKQWHQNNWPVNIWVSGKRVLLVTTWASLSRKPLSHLENWAWCLVVVESLRRVHLLAALWTAECQASLSVSPRICSNSGLLTWWCYLTTSSSVVPCSSCPQSFPASGSFPMSVIISQWVWSCNDHTDERSFWWRIFNESS